MKILITGSNGLLGQKLVKLLIENNEEVIATAHNGNRLPAKYSGYTFEVMDITDPVSVQKVLQKHNPEAVINTAAMTNVDECEKDKEGCDLLNVEAVKHLIEGCNHIHAHLIHLSTDFIFDGSHGPLAEDEQPNPISYYGESKLKSEQLVKKDSKKWSIIRTVLVYGIAHDMSRSNIILWVKNSLENGKNIQVVNDQWRTPTLAEDLAEGCYLVTKNKAEGIFHISGSDMLTPYEIAIKTADFFDLDASLIEETDGSKFTQPAKRPPKTGFIIEKAKKQLGYQPHSFTEGLKVLAGQLQSS
ncbi:SDR family oxidoreductase [Fulvivirga lutea]|uniref:dTDP-4-dehydrorhamnose reductase n=1 Tax=Fulvivirga lutea TaxID=2810512 RepID=A0A975A1Z9_9BACT|nr:SDR family oxidoreductase [Fulvivirga lutea]QSE98901.1 SDR family oxidoreductase [Fulvivirga lutea]